MTSMIGNTGMRGATGHAGGQNMTGNIIPKGYKYGQIQRYNPDMMKLFQSLFGNLGPDSYLSKLAGGDEKVFEQLEAPALRQFQGLQGQLASRFGGAGTGGALKSSGYRNAASQYASDFAQQLQANRMGIQQGAITQLHQLANELLRQNPYEQYLIGKQKSEGGWGGPIGAGLGALGGFFLGGPPGALVGGKLGYDVGSSF